MIRRNGRNIKKRYNIVQDESWLSLVSSHQLNLNQKTAYCAKQNNQFFVMFNGFFYSLGLFKNIDVANSKLSQYDYIFKVTSRAGLLVKLSSTLTNYKIACYQVY